MKMFKSEKIFIALFVFVVGIFFYRTIFQNKLPVPSDALVGLYHPWRDLYADSNPRGMPFKNFLITDPVRQQIPWRKIVMEQWKDWKLPQWNPYGFSGTPLAANIQAAAFYPLNIVFFLFSFPTAWTILIVLEPLLAGIFLYIYLRSLKLHPLASLFGAIVWSLGGFNIAWLTWGTIGHVALWLPLMLLAIDKSMLFLFVAGLVCSFFAGHSQVFLYVALLCAVYATWRKKMSQKMLLWTFFIFLVVTAVQWVPLLKFLPQANRLDDPTTWQKPGWFLPWQHLVQFLAPDFFGNPTTLNYWGEWNYGEFIGYIGSISLIFVGLALVVREIMSKFWLSVLVVSLILMLPNPLSKLPYQFHIPVLSALQPTRLMVLVDFSLAILAAFGLNSFLRRPPKTIFLVILVIGVLFTSLWGFTILGPRFVSSELVANLSIAKRNLILPTILFVIGSAVTALWLRFSKKKNSSMIFGLTLLVILSFDLLRFGWKFTPFTDAKYFFPETKVVAFLQKQVQPFRIMSLDSRLLPPNTSAYYGLEGVEGYDPLYRRQYEQFIAASERGKPDISPPYGFNRIITPHNVDSPLLPLLNVRYVLSLVDIERPFLRKVFQEGETRIYEDSRSLPRAYFVEDVIFEKDRQRILERLFEKEFQGRKTAFIEKQMSLVSIPVMFSEYVTVKEYSSNIMQLDVQAENTRFLVISNLYDAGWKAFLDGKETQIYQSNFLFQGILVPTGKRHVILRYRG